jgi:signal transduction histidine kinase/ligand-binding sensor domain-containing protein
MRIESIKKLNLMRIGMVLSLWLAGLSLQAQQQQINPEYITVQEGLATTRVIDVMQDSYGLIWLTSSNGLQKYDGYTFENFRNIPGDPTSLQSNLVWDVIEDANHDLWIANGKGISRYNRQTNKFKNYEFAKSFKRNVTQIDGYRCFIDSKGRLWALSHYFEILRYDADIDEWKLAEYEVPGIPNPTHMSPSFAMTEDNQGGIWVGSSNHGLMYQSPGEEVFKPIPNDKLGNIEFNSPDYPKAYQPDNLITALYADSTNTLWFTTPFGVYKYNYITETFKIIKEYKGQGNNSPNHINCILPDPDGNIWITNNNRGILKFEGISDKFEEITLKGRLKGADKNWDIAVEQLMIDKSGIFWFGTSAGLLKYNPLKSPFGYFTSDTDKPNSLKGRAVLSIVPSSVNPETVYIGTADAGLNIYNKNSDSFEQKTFNKRDNTTGGTIRTISENQDGTLWLGTEANGLIELDENYEEIGRYFYESSSSTNSVYNSRILALKEDQQNRLWIGRRDGLSTLNLKTKTIEKFAYKYTVTYPEDLVTELERKMDTDEKMASIEQVTDNQNLAVPLEISKAGTYWVMAVGEANVNQMTDYGWIENATNDTIWQMQTYANSFYAGGSIKNRIDIEPLTLEPGSYTIHYTSDGDHSYNNWNADAPNQTSLYGIALLESKKTDLVNSMKLDEAVQKKQKAITDNFIIDIEVSDKYVWVSYSGFGLDRIDLSTNEVKNYQNDINIPNSLVSNMVFKIYEDRQGVLWLATDQGINSFDPVTEKFMRYSEEDGLSTNQVRGILEGEEGEMWFSTTKGLSQMVTNPNLEKVTFINYGLSDGLGGDSFSNGPAARSSDGQYYFGGELGLITFSTFTTNKTPPEIIISNLLISNKSVLSMGEASPLIESLLETKSITLSYDQNNLSFEYAALHYADPEKNQYAHKLIGYDDEWIYDNRNFASYTNLSPGKYEFVVRASNAYGIWNEDGRSIVITILPPWWLTWWAYTSYALLFFILIFFTYRAVQKSIRLRERELTRERELAQAKEIEKAYNQLKSTQAQLIQSEKMASLGELTAGIAHEIQNPLNFVNNFSEVSAELVDEMKEELAAGSVQLAVEIADDLKQNLEKITFHGKRADAIVKGMLEHSRTNKGEKAPTDLNALADEFVRLSYHGLRAKDKSFNSDFKLELEPDLPKVNVVASDIGRVILNLVNNAFYACAERSRSTVDEKAKSTPQPSEGGEGYKPLVTVKTTVVKSPLGDLGVEISVQDNGPGIPEHIKEKIFQPFFTTKPTGSGTGLGLSLSYDIVKAHGGELKVESRENKGAEFIITLPFQPI